MESTKSNFIYRRLMHFYTEAPITSFFPLITASKKRKIHTDPTPSGSASKKWQKDHTSTTSRQGTKSMTKEAGQEHHTLDNGTIPSPHSPSVKDLSTPRPMTSERHIPPFPGLNTKDVTPQTHMSNTLPPPRNRCKTSLQTPPPTNAAAERQQSMELTPTLSPFMSRTSPNLRIEEFLIPTPTTLGRSASHHNGHSGNDRCRVVQEHLSHQDTSSSTPPQHPDTSLKASVPVSIPSSQSQLMANIYSEDEYHLVPGEESTSTQMFISSSQSQFLSPLDDHDSPQKLQTNSTTSNPELDLIPSSQSQELDLRILSGPEECYQSIRSRKQALPASDDLFPVSILQTGWSDGNLNSEQPIQGIADYCVTNNVDDSATESETESETEEKDSYDLDHRLLPMQSQPGGSSQLSTAVLTSPDEDSQHENLRNSQPSSQDLSLVDQTSSFASLPTVVKEFQSMFGSDDESYPPDFPMSLR